MALWMRFEAAGTEHFGTLEGDSLTVWHGDMFATPQPTAQHGAAAVHVSGADDAAARPAGC